MEGVVLFFFPSGRAGWGRRVLGGGEKRRGREPVWEEENLRGRELGSERGLGGKNYATNYLFQFFKLVKSSVAVFKQIKDT